MTYRTGAIALFPFPFSDQVHSKLRPALLLQKVPGEFSDWLVCMISSRLIHAIAGFDEIIREGDEDFSTTGLKRSSLIRVGRLAVIEESMLLGAIGCISSQRLEKIATNLATWIQSVE